MYFIFTSFSHLTVTTKQKLRYILTFQSLAVCYNALYEQYSNFVGAPHIATIVRLCGYQDIAVILTELLEVVNSIVSTD